MKTEENILYIDEKIDYEDCQELITLAENCDEINVQTNDVHPSIWQVLFTLSSYKTITVEDEFNKRFFENLKLVS